MWTFQLIAFLVSFPLFVVTQGHAFKERYKEHKAAQFILGLVAILSFAFLVVEAVRYYNAYWEPAPIATLQTAEQHYLRGIESADGGRNAEAIRDFDAALAMRPNHVDALVRRGRAYAALGQSDRALVDFDIALRIAPSHAEAMDQRWLIYDEKAERLLEPLWADINATR